MADTNWTPPRLSREQIRSLPSDDLRAIVRSTNPAGSLWVELVAARSELERRGDTA